MRKPHFEEARNLFPILGKESPFLRKAFKEPSLFFSLATLMIDLSERTLKKGKYACAPQIVSLLSLFQAQDEKIYKIAREFGESLHKANLKVSNKYLPITEEMICIEFPDHIRFSVNPPGAKDFDGYAHCAYIGTSRIKKECVTFQDQLPIEKAILIYIPHYTESGTLNPGTYDQLVISFANDDEDIQVALDRSYKNSTSPFNPKLVDFLLKSLLYIYSGNPDLREQKAKKPPRQPKELRRFLKENQENSLVDLFHVGFNWKKSILYSMSETTVSGHFRWQPYGPGRSKVELIWINEHIRQFNND